MTSVSAAMEQSSNNVSMVATATEEISSTVKEIAQHTEGKSISDQAVYQSQQSLEKMNALGKSADNIGRVTQMINDISAQTDIIWP